MNNNNSIDDFNYHLDINLIAQYPKINRSNSRLLIHQDQHIQDKLFTDILQFINKNDLIIFNDSKVMKARLFGKKITGGRVELLIERIINNKQILAHVRTNKTIKINMVIICENNFTVRVTSGDSGLFLLMQESNFNTYDYLDEYGTIPLPPYITRDANALDIHSYQTLYAKNLGSVAAPTAGLHFGDELLTSLKNHCNIAYVTLHVGAGTFKPVTVNNIADHIMHQEYYSIPRATIELINQTKSNGGKIIAVGTTSLRTLESFARSDYRAYSGMTDIFIKPGYKFQLVDRLITNFHLPKSTLLMLVAAFVGLENMHAIYQHAIKEQYQFFSYGDAMFLNKNV